MSLEEAPMTSESPSGFGKLDTAFPEQAADQVLEWCGIRSLASVMEISQAELAISAAAVVGGAAGPGSLIEAPWGCLTLPPLDISNHRQKQADRTIVNAGIAAIEKRSQRAGTPPEHPPCLDRQR